ncbi:MAG: ADP-ribosylation factor-like protein [Asgard group archaeon]|nr:ADP-ribosylation factor-like protein [Asgard group archaeon]
MRASRRALESFSKHFSKEKHTIPWILMMGEKGSGKTSCLYYLLSSNRDKIYPETAINWIDISYGPEWFKLIDLGKELSEDKEIVEYFLSIVDGLVYIIKGEDKESLKESVKTFHETIEKVPSNVPILVMINKYEKDFDIDINDIMNYFDLSKISSPVEPRSFHFEICNIITGQGVYRAFDWFVSKLLSYEGYHETVNIHRVLIYDVNGLLDLDLQFTDVINDQYDAVLLTGLLSAVNSMTSTIFKGKNYLDVITVGDFSMVLVSRGQKICCLFVERGGAIGKAKQIAEMILDICFEEEKDGILAIESLVEENRHKDDFLL